MKDRNKLANIIYGALLGAIVATMVLNHWHKEEIHNFQVDAIQMECGFWNIDGDFDWKHQDLRIED